MAAALRTICTAPTVEAAEQRLDDFAATWAATYLTISQAWRRNWDHDLIVDPRSETAAKR